jgi:hypothetical protein
MSQDAYNRYTSGGGRPVDDMGGTIPGIEFSESERPAVGLQPAPYLPVVRFDVHKRANVVLSAGAPVGLDTQGNLIPAGLPGGHAFTYSALDFATSLVATRKAADGTAVAAAGNSIASSTLLSDAAGTFARPIGVVSYTVFSHEGGFAAGTWPAYTITHDNPLTFGVHNTMAQDLVAVTCDYVLQVPYLFGKNLLSLVAKATDNDANEVAVLSATAKSFPFAHDELIADATVTIQASGQVVSTGASGTLTNLEVVFVSPACGTGDNGVELLGNQWIVIASGAQTTTGALAASVVLSCSGAVDPAAAGTGVALATLSTKGNHVLYTAETEKYIVVKNRTGGTAVAGGANAVTFLLKLGAQIKPGDPVVCRVGKFVKFDATRHDVDEIIGQCLRVDKSPVNKDYLTNVKTAYERSSTVSHRMAGSATRGVPFLLHLVSDGAQVIDSTNKQLTGVALTDDTVATPPLALVVINMTR